MIGLILKTLTEMVDSSIMQQYTEKRRVYMVVVFKNRFLFLNTKNTKNLFDRGNSSYFFCSCVLKMAFFREQKKNVVFVIFLTVQRTKKKTLFFMFFFSLFSHFISSNIVRMFPTTRNEGNSTNTSVFFFYFCTY